MLAAMPPSSCREMARQADMAANKALAFGPFRLLPRQKILLKDNEPVRLGVRTIDLLAMLASHAGSPVAKEALMAEAWPDSSVNETNLRVHIAALRRALGDGHGGARYITNIPGRGYCFVASVRRLDQEAAVDTVPAATEAAGTLPSLLTRVIGREDALAELAEDVTQHRLVTVIGTAGIGKTTVAVATATALAGAFRDGARFVDLAPLGEPRLAIGTTAAALGVPATVNDPLPSLVSFLRDKQMLIVLDNCEHVVEAAAILAAAILRGAGGVRILATSREPLRAEGERLRSLPPLRSPAPSQQLTSKQALGYAAIQLFVDRATASLDTFELEEADVPVMAELCRRLDGIPLAIELVAARIEAFGVRELAAHIDDRFQLLTAGRRTALPRHHTLRASLDWSYEALSEREQQTLQRLALFRGSFSLKAAVAIADADEADEAATVDCITNLAAKSLVATEVSGDAISYRLLEMTRDYAREKLGATGQFDRVARRHAEYHQKLLQAAQAEWETRSTRDWLADYAGQIDNLHAALDWAFGPAQAIETGVALVVAAMPLWFQLSLVQECRARFEQALAALGPESHRESRQDAILLSALGTALLYTIGSRPETRTAHARSLAIADRLDDADCRIRATWGLWVTAFAGSDMANMARLADRFAELARAGRDPMNLVVADRLIGTTELYRGRLDQARRFLESSLARHQRSTGRTQVVRTQFDQRLTACIFLSQTLWLQGHVDQAMALAHRTVGEAAALGHVMTHSFALVDSACPTAYLTGDYAAARGFAATLLDNCAKYPFGPWRAWAHCFDGALRIKAGALNEGVDLLRGAIGELAETHWRLRHAHFLGELAAALKVAGKPAEALVAINQAIDHCERSRERWQHAELLRIKGEIVDDAAEATNLFERSLTIAREQGALSWELRTALSLASLQKEQGRTEDAVRLVGSVYGRFTEGFSTPTLLQARALLEDLP
jgi:predicted ATPase/DNA-binding winged helix-turn-helix (wHTH) protein